MRGGLAGWLAGFSMESKLTPLLLLASLVLGAFTLWTMPSEEEPQIIVPVADLYLPLPGAEPEEVENRLLIPLEQVVSGIEGVEYVYSHADAGFGLLTVRFEVGRDPEESVTRLLSTLLKHADRMPPGLSWPLVKTVSIDDVPFFSVTLSSTSLDVDALRSLADEVRVELATVPEVRDVRAIGGAPREVRVGLDPDRLAAYGLDPAGVSARLAGWNRSLRAGEFVHDNRVVPVEVGGFLRSAEDVRGVVVAVHEGRPVRVGDVAHVVDGPAEADTYTLLTEDGAGWRPMVSLAVAKRPGADATEVGRALEARLRGLEGVLIPADVTVEVTRNYGETARDKVTTLKEHLGLAIVAVGLVILFTMGWRAALVVMMAVPVTFALTLFVYQVFGYTLNRVTLFALIFVTGIVIDDSIIVAENMERHFSMRDRPLRQAARAAVDEVGNPTILATLTVIAAVLPMLFVSGLMGPYMSPMPIGSTLAMLFSLGVALTITPWLAYRLLGRAHAGDGREEAAPGDGVGEAPAYRVEDTRLYRFYARIMGPLLARRGRLWAVMAGVSVLLLGAGALFVTRAVSVKMLPFDDKNELQIIVDVPEGTTLEATTALAQDVARAVAGVPEVRRVQLFAGTAAPVNFNGLIRHYYLRRGPHVADLQVDLIDKGMREARSHDVALRLRPLVDSVAAAWGAGARVKVVEVPPGPPVLSTLVAEVYGPDDVSRTALAEKVFAAFQAHPSVVDVDWSRAAAQERAVWRIDPERAALAGVDKGAAIAALRAALAGQVATELAVPGARTPVPVRVRLETSARAGRERLQALGVARADGRGLVPLAELVDARSEVAPQPIDRKNGRRVVYVTAEVAGRIESPVYAILDLAGPLADETGALQLYRRGPGLVEGGVLKWDGEWQITYEVFRDLGIAFAGALALIYVLIVAWFGSFVTPAVMMAAIPLTLVGVAPGHVLFGAFFTATSMIGMIALAGIMVRNGILLIDYLEARRADGVPLERAILEAGAVRTRPIALTAGTVVIGALVILFDPIFQGLAVSLVTGALASTVLTLVVVPGLYALLRAPRRTPSQEV